MMTDIVKLEVSTYDKPTMGEWFMLLLLYVHALFDVLVDDKYHVPMYASIVVTLIMCGGYYVNIPTQTIKD